MIRVTVPRPVAEALMPRQCPHVDCEGEGDTHCWGCHGSGVLPPTLNLLVVEGDVCPCVPDPAPAEWCAGCPGVHAPADIVRAIEAGERIGIDVEPEDALCPGCKACGPRCAIPRRVRVGSVRPVRVLPVVICQDPRDDDRVSVGFDPSNAGAIWRDNVVDGVVDLSVYGPAESLIGKFAVGVEDARRGE